MYHVQQDACPGVGEPNEEKNDNPFDPPEENEYNTGTDDSGLSDSDEEDSEKRRKPHIQKEAVYVFLATASNETNKDWYLGRANTDAFLKDEVWTTEITWFEAVGPRDKTVQSRFVLNHKMKGKKKWESIWCGAIITAVKLTGRGYINKHDQQRLLKKLERLKLKA